MLASVNGDTVVEREVVASGETDLLDLTGRPRSRLRRVVTNRYLLRFVSIFATLGVWEAYGRTVNPIFLSYPTQIARTFPSVLSSAEFHKGLLASLSELGLGFIIALVLGMAVGFLMGLSRSFENLIDVQVNALYSTPIVAIIPILVLWLGLGYRAKVVVILLEAVFPIIINTFSGVRNVSSQYFEIVRVEDASGLQTFTKVVVPATLPFVMTGIRIAVARSVVGMIVAEELTSIAGLGGLIVNFSSAFKTADTFVIVIIVVILGVVLTQVAKYLERRAAPWRFTEEES